MNTEDGSGIKRRTEKLLAMSKFADSLAELSVGKLRKVGVVIFNCECTEVLAMGYNGPPTGEDHEQCHDDPSTPSGDLHAEVNALIKLRSRETAVMCVTASPCTLCAGYVANVKQIRFLIFGPDKAPVGGMRRLAKHGVRVIDRASLEILATFDTEAFKSLTSARMSHAVDFVRSVKLCQGS